MKNLWEGKRNCSPYNTFEYCMGSQFDNFIICSGISKFLHILPRTERERERDGSRANVHTRLRAILADAEAQSESCFGVLVPLHRHHFVLYSRCYARQLRSTGTSTNTAMLILLEFDSRCFRFFNSAIVFYSIFNMWYMFNAEWISVLGFFFLLFIYF